MSSGPTMAGGPDGAGPELTARICRYCRRFYLAPLGSRPHACPGCAPTLMDAIEEAETNGSPLADTPGRLIPGGSSQPEPSASSIAIYPEPPHWTASECQVKGCGEPSGVNIEGWIVCIDHADDWLDRTEAIELHPRLRELLPALGDV